MYSLLKFLPKNHLSWCTGKLAELPLPKALRGPVLGWYISRYKVAESDFEGPLERFPSLAAFFRRDLRKGIRPIGVGIVSPVDGCLVNSGSIIEGRLFQAKGKEYLLAELLSSNELAEDFQGGVFATIYLAPGDYHHIHAPVDGRIIESIHSEGTLWPVNGWSVEHIDRLFTRNERITTVLDSAYGKVAVVKVGATNVGSITTTYNSMRGNNRLHWWRRKPQVFRETYQDGKVVSKGERIGSFRMGSTVILLVQQGVLRNELPQGPITLGTALPMLEEQQVHG